MILIHYNEVDSKEPIQVKCGPGMEWDTNKFCDEKDLEKSTIMTMSDIFTSESCGN